jgi:hypothetical protein
MTLGTQVSFSNINTENLRNATDQISLNQSFVRYLQSSSANTATSGPVSLSLMQNQSAVKFAGTSYPLGRIADNGSGIMVAAECDGASYNSNGGGLIFRSTDGTTWSNVSDLFLKSYKGCSGVWYLNGKFIASMAAPTTGYILIYSTDGLTWTEGSIVGSITDLAWNGTYYVGVTASYTVYYGTDLISAWSSWTDSGFKSWYSIAWTGTYFVGFGNFVPKYASNPTAFANFTAVSGMGTDWGSHYIKGTSLYITWFYASSSNLPNLYSSSDGVTWSLAGTRPNNTLATGSDSKFGYFWSSYFYIPCQDGKIYRSTNGVSWALVYTDSETTMNALTSSGSTLYATGGGGKIISTTNGTSWSTVTVSIPYRINDVVYANSLFVAVGASAKGGGGIYTSTDGITWTQRVNAATTGLSISGFTGICWSGSQFVALTSDGSTVYTSSAGTSWSASATNLPTAGRTWGGIAYGASTYVAVVRSGGQSEWYYSSNATSWTSVTLPTYRAYSLNRVRYVNGYFIAVWSAGWPIVYSTNGSTVSDGTSNINAWDITYNGSVYVAVGQSVPGWYFTASSPPVSWASQNWGNAYSVTAKTSTFTTYRPVTYPYAKIEYESSSASYNVQPLRYTSGGINAGFLGSANNGTTAVFGGDRLIAWDL